MNTAFIITAFSVVLIQVSLAHICYNSLENLRHDRVKTSLDDGVIIKVSTTTLTMSGQWVNVTWSGVQNPSKSDWIGVYSPPVNNTIDPVHYAPVKYQFADFSSTHLSTGAGMLRFRLVNMREEVIVGFFRGGLENAVLTAVSQVITFANPNEPLQGHLSYGGNPTEMTLIWVTKEIGTPEVVLYTQSGNETIYRKPASTSTYSAKDMCGSPATDVGYRDPGILNQVTLDQLSPGKTYSYKFGDDKFGWSPVYQFNAAPTASPSTSVRVVAFGDMGNGQEDDSKQCLPKQQPALTTIHRVKNELNSGGLDLVLHIGDISYARGYASVWDEFFDEIQDVATRVPYMVCIGNHERDFPNSGSFFNVVDSGGECGVPYERRFAMPRPSQDEPWYGFDYGSIHFVLMSTEQNFSVGSPQYMFLDKHLSQVDRSVTPWLIFSGHRPMYIDSTNNKGSDSDISGAQELQKWIEPLLVKYRVDLAFWGHHHSYQRTCPVYQQKCDGKNGVTHIVIGMGGQGLSKDVHLFPPAWLQKIDVEHYGYSRFTAVSNKLEFEYVHDDSGSVYDHLTMEKVPV